MARVLVVPIHLDVLCLDADRDVTESPADFTRLPYVDPATGQDRQADLPYLSEVMLAEPFEDQNLRLRAGMHLHWALPDALTRLVRNGGVTEVPVVPNRWLVTRSLDGTVDGRWVIESDFRSDDNVSGVAYPVTGEAGRPYTWLGRRVPLELWAPSTDPRRYLPELTAVGYGDATFAAFYPSCHSVFGFHDPDHVGIPPTGLRYEVMGWYADVTRDPVAKSGKDWRRLLSELSWSIPNGTANNDTASPERMVCYASLTFAPERTTASPLLVDAETGVWVGNGATEALAAHLGATLPPGDGPGQATADEIEELLEAIAFAEELESRQLDLGIKLAESRHADTFRTVPAGVVWTIRRQDDSGEIGAHQKQLRERLRPPALLGDLLSELNEAQQAYDSARWELASLRDRLFADWHKYLLCAYPYDTTQDSYPDPDLVRFYLRRQAERISELVARTGVTNDAGNADDKNPGDTDVPAAPGSLAYRLRQARAALDQVLAAYNVTQAQPARSRYEVQQVAAPRFYLPEEPVVLLTGAAATPTDRHGQDGAADPDGLLPCAVTGDAPQPVEPKAVAALHRQVAEAAGTLPKPNFAHRVWRTNPWHPLMLQWEVEFFPAAAGNNLNPANRDYDPDFVTGNYILPDQDVELSPIPGRGLPDKAANVYWGSSILSPAARPVMSARMLRYLEGTALTACNKARTAAALPPVAVDDFRVDPTAVLDWYGEHGTETRIKTLIRLYRHLAVNERNNLAQSLGGFNDALLMRRMVRQLPIADPLGFPPDQEFAALVAEAVAGETALAPQPLRDFNPIRAGAMRVRRLRMVDNFGITSDVDVGRIATTTRLRVPKRPGWIALPPRLAQPARLSLRWLEAAHQLREAGPLPDSSPVCGWIVPNNLDDGLAVYAADGATLGTLYALPDLENSAWAQWRAAPGRRVLPLGDIGNAHLRTVVQRLRDSGADAVAAFLRMLDEALAGIEPADYAAHRAQAVLAGRPVAVVRAALNLELMGLPAVHQDWNVFRQDLGRASRETDSVTLVRFPVRLGEHFQLDDGVVGYWLEDGVGRLGPDFHPAQATGEVLLQAIDQPTQYLTMLVDPRGAVHATSGILPTKAIRIPAEHYRDTLAALELDFFTAPVLSGGGRFAVPVPTEPGHLWSWRERAGAAWAEVAIDAPALDLQFPTEPTMREGWLTLRPAPDQEQGFA